MEDALEKKEKPILSVDNLEVVYNEVILVLRGISMNVSEGEIVALLGANGAGKTTLLRSITGLLEIHRGKITKGSVSFLGEKTNRYDPSRLVRAGLSQVMEGRRIFAELTVEENLKAGAYTVASRQKIAEAHDRVVGLFPVLASRSRSTAGYLSGGEQQMLAIGRALMTSPRLLVLDEPSLGLAPIIVDTVYSILHTLREQGITLLVVEQSTHRALENADRIYVLRRGQIELHGKSAELTDAELEHAYFGFDEQE